MKANEFVKKFGLDDAKNIVCGWIRRDFDDSYHIAEGIYCNLPFEPTDDCGTLSLFDLKRLVESHDLVALRGGLDAAKHELITLQKHLHKTFGWVTIITSEKIDRLKQAIIDVESCQ